MEPVNYPKRKQSFLNKLEKIITPFILEQNLPVLNTTLLTNQLICKVCKFWWFRLRFRQRLWLVPHSVFIVLHAAKYYKNIIKPDTVLVKVCLLLQHRIHNSKYRLPFRFCVLILPRYYKN